MKLAIKKLNRKFLGECNYHEGFIYIDIHKDANHAIVLLHEIIHATLPGLPEETVLKAERVIWKHLSAEQKLALVRLLAQAVVVGE